MHLGSRGVRYDEAPQSKNSSWTPQVNIQNNGLVDEGLGIRVGGVGII